jgi:hypothetical protein
MFRYLPLLLLMSAPAFADAYLNPEFSGKSYAKILVTCPVQDLAFRQKMEKSTIKYMKKYVKTTGFTSLELFPPYEEVPDDKYMRMLKGMNLEAVLAVESADAERSFPPNYRRSSKTFAMSYVSTRHNRHISATSTLYDVSTGHAVWVGSLDFTDDGKDIIKEVSSRTVRYLLKAHLLEGKPKEPSWWQNSNSQSDTKENKNE